MASGCSRPVRAGSRPHAPLSPLEGEMSLIGDRGGNGHRPIPPPDGAGKGLVPFGHHPSAPLVPRRPMPSPRLSSRPQAQPESRGSIGNPGGCGGPSRLQRASSPSPLAVGNAVVAACGPARDLPDLHHSRSGNARLASRGFTSPGGTARGVGWRPDAVGRFGPGAGHTRRSPPLRGRCPRKGDRGGNGTGRPGCHMLLAKALTLLGVIPPHRWCHAGLASPSDVIPGRRRSRRAGDPLATPAVVVGTVGRGGRGARRRQGGGTALCRRGLVAAALATNGPPLSAALRRG